MSCCSVSAKSMREFYRRIPASAGGGDGHIVRRTDARGGQAGPRRVRGAREGSNGDGADRGRGRAGGRGHRHRFRRRPAGPGGRPDRRSGGMCAAMAVRELYALQNGFMGAQRSLLFYGEFAEARTQIPITSYVVRTDDAVILYDTGVSPRAVPGLLRNDTLARFTDDDLLVHRLEGVGLEPKDVDLVVLSHLHYDHAGGAEFFRDSELVAQKDEYAYAHSPASFFASFYYRKNFDLPGYRWRLLDGDSELVPGVTAVRSDGHTPGHQSLLVELPESGPVILAGDSCYWQGPIR